MQKGSSLEPPGAPRGATRAGQWAGRWAVGDEVPIHLKELLHLLKYVFI